MLPPASLSFVAAITIITPVTAIILWCQTAETALLNTRKGSWANPLLGAMHARLIAPALFWRNGIAAQQRVNGCRNIFMHQDVIAVNDLYHHVKRWRCLPL